MDDKATKSDYFTTIHVRAGGKEEWIVVAGVEKSAAKGIPPQNPEPAWKDEYPFQLVRNQSDLVFGGRLAEEAAKVRTSMKIVLRTKVDNTWLLVLDRNRREWVREGFFGEPEKKIEFKESPTEGVTKWNGKVVPMDREKRISFFRNELKAEVAKSSPKKNKGKKNHAEKKWEKEHEAQMEECADKLRIAILDGLAHSNNAQDVFKKFKEASGEKAMGFQETKTEEGCKVLMDFAKYIIDNSGSSALGELKKKWEDGCKDKLQNAKNKMGTLEVWAAPKESRDPKKNGVLLFRGQCEQN
jgi:hypothetical protein